MQYRSECAFAAYTHQTYYIYTQTLSAYISLKSILTVCVYIVFQEFVGRLLFWRRHIPFNIHLSHTVHTHKCTQTHIQTKANIQTVKIRTSSQKICGFVLHQTDNLHCSIVCCRFIAFLYYFISVFFTSMPLSLAFALLNLAK